MIGVLAQLPPAEPTTAEIRIVEEATWSCRPRLLGGWDTGNGLAVAIEADDESFTRINKYRNHLPIEGTGSPWSWRLVAGLDVIPGVRTAGRVRLAGGMSWYESHRKWAIGLAPGVHAEADFAGGSGAGALLDLDIRALPWVGLDLAPTWEIYGQGSFRPSWSPTWAIMAWLDPLSLWQVVGLGQ